MKIVAIEARHDPRCAAGTPWEVNECAVSVCRREADVLSTRYSHCVRISNHRFSSLDEHNGCFRTRNGNPVTTADPGRKQVPLAEQNPTYTVEEVACDPRPPCGLRRNAATCARRLGVAIRGRFDPAGRRNLRRPLDVDP